MLLGDVFTQNADPAELFLPAWNDLTIIDIVRDIAGGCGEHRTGGPQARGGLEQDSAFNRT